jgi:hypothetical protein
MHQPGQSVEESMPQQIRELGVPAVEVLYQLDELKMQDCCRVYTWPESVQCNLFDVNMRLYAIIFNATTYQVHPQ